MKNSIAQGLTAATLVLGLGFTVVVPSHADSSTLPKQNDSVAEYRADKSNFESALDTYNKAPNSTKAARAAKAALKLVAQAAQRKAEADRVVALQQAFATYTEALKRANTAYAAAMSAAGKNAASKVAARNAKNEAVATATVAYNAAKAELKPLPRIT